MKKSYAFIAQKGGTGKTTTALSVAGGLVKCGQRVLLLDVDMQQNSSFVSNVPVECQSNYISDVLKENCTPADAILRTSSGFDIILADNGIAAIEAASRLPGFTIKDIIESVEDDYDYVLIDCPPAISKMTLMAMGAVDEIVIPLNADIYSINSLGQIIESVKEVKKKNKKLKIAGMLLTRYHGYTLEKMVLERLKEIAELNQTVIFENTIPENVSIRECVCIPQTIFEYDSKSKGAEAYRHFIKELNGEEFKREKAAKKAGTRRGIQRSHERTTGGPKKRSRQTTKTVKK